MDKLGLHVICGARVALGRPAIVKLVNVSAEYVRQVRAQVGPDCLILVRWVEALQPLSNPEAEAEGWFNAKCNQMRAMADPNVAFEGYNEVPDHLAALYARFEARRLQLMRAAGYRAGVGCWSVGTPDIPVWPTYKAALDAMGPGDVVSLHEYWADGGDLGNHWLCGRFAHPDVAPYLAGKRVVISECGRDIIGGRGKPGWRLTTGADTFLSELRRYNDVLCRYPNVVGATVFTVGNDPAWSAFDVADLWPRVVAEYAAQPVVVSQPAPTPQPTPQPTFTYDGRRFSGTEYLEYVRAATATVRRVILHHTYKPTLADWRGATTMEAMRRVYEGRGWTCGPHAFVAGDGIWLMSPLGGPNKGAGWEATTDINVEIVGDYTVALPAGVVLDNALTCVAGLLIKGNLGIDALSKHNDHAATQCPGARLSAQWSWFRASVHERLVALTRPPRRGLPTDETATDARTLAEKVRWWVEEMVRQREAGDTAYADDILRALIDRQAGLLYRLERALKAA